MKAIVNGNLYTPDQVLAPGTVLIEGERIGAVGPAEALTVPPGVEVLDAEGMAVVPGFIDLHLHGLMGHDAMGPELAQVIRDLPAFGVTAFLGIKVKVTRTQTCGIMGRAQQHRRRSAVHGQDNQALGSKSTVHLQSGD